MCVAILVFFIPNNKGMKNKNNHRLSLSTTGPLSHTGSLSHTQALSHIHSHTHHTGSLSNHRLSLTHTTTGGTGGRNGTAQFFSTVGVDSAEGKA